MSLLGDSAGYVVPSYRVDDDDPWFHFLHGNVPGHQIDFMYRAEVPQGRLTRQHFSHLSRLMKYIEPHTNAPYAFAIGNLSRDDTQHEPGRGGLALIFGLRIRGVTDHAGRQDPPFSHGIAAIDRELDAGALLAAACSFHRHVLGATESAEWYRAYVRCANEAPAEMPGVLAGYVSAFRDLPRPAESSMTTRWLLGGATLPRRIVLVHADDAPFEALARAACRIAAMLYQSDLRWTSITNGREADVPNGVSIRLVTESAVTPADEALGVRWIDDIPEDEAEIARALFNAAPAVQEKPAARGWRERYSALGDAPAMEGEALRASWEGAASPPRPLSERPRPLPPSDLADWQHRRSSSPGGRPDRASVDDQAVTMGAPLQRVDPSPPAAPALSDAIDVLVDDDPSERRASFDLGPALPPSADDLPTRHAGFQRETVQLSPSDVQRSLADVLPFRPVPEPPATTDSRVTPEPMPEFRSWPLRGWRWVILLAVICALVIGFLYLLSAAPSAPAAPAVSAAAPQASVSPPPPPPPLPLPSAPTVGPPPTSSTAAKRAPPKVQRPKAGKPSSVFNPSSPQLLE